jgi:hypothetical protein
MFRFKLPFKKIFLKTYIRVLRREEKETGVGKLKLYMYLQRLSSFPSKSFLISKLYY